MASLGKSGRTDLFDVAKVEDDLTGFSFDYFFTGKRFHKKSSIVELFVVTWVRDSAENLFIRYCKYMGEGKFWKTIIEKQLLDLMRDIAISEGFIKSELRFFEVEKEKHFETDVFENKFLDLKAKMKTLR